MSFILEDELKYLQDKNKERSSSYAKLESQQVPTDSFVDFEKRLCVLLKEGVNVNLFYFMQNELSKVKDELEGEKRELVRTLERRSQEMEHQSGI